VGRARRGASPASAHASRRPRRTPDEARLIERFRRLAPQRDALKLALRPFTDDGGSFDRAAWARAFESPDPTDIVAVTAVTGLYEGLVNHLVEMLHVAARLRGLDAARAADKPSGPALFAAVREDGGLTASKEQVLTRLYATRNELQHASLNVEAGQVFDDVVLLGKTLAGFAATYVVWLERHGIALLPLQR
jgi:hypothetical protein